METNGLTPSEHGGTVRAMSPDLIGFAELPDLLAVSRATAARYANRADFPDPVGELNGGRVWRRRDVERWATKNPPDESTGRRPQRS